MSISIVSKHSSVKNKIPTAAQLQPGELALNIHHGSLSGYAIDNQNNVQQMFGTATETQSGQLPIATTAQAKAGTNDATIVTPLKLEQVNAVERSANDAKYLNLTGGALTGNLTSTQNIAVDKDLSSDRYLVKAGDDSGLVYEQSPTVTTPVLRLIDFQHASQTGNGKIINLAPGNWWDELRLGSYVKVNGFRNTWASGDDVLPHPSFAYVSGNTANQNVGGSGPQNSKYSLVCNDRIGAKQFDAYSDRRLKEAIRPVQSDDAVRFVEDVNPVLFGWKEDITQPDSPDAVPTEFGYIAQEVGKAGFGELVSAVEEDMKGAANAEPEDPENVKFTIDYSSAVPLLHQALREAFRQIAELKAEVAAKG